MTPHLIARLAPLAVLAAIPACSSPPSEQAGDPAAKADAAAGLAIESVAARAVEILAASVQYLDAPRHADAEPATVGAANGKGVSGGDDLPA